MNSCCSLEIIQIFMRISKLMEPFLSGPLPTSPVLPPPSRSFSGYLDPVSFLPKYHVLSWNSSLHILCSLPGNAAPCPLLPPHYTHPLTLFSDLTSSRKASLSCLCSRGPQRPTRCVCLPLSGSTLACQPCKGRALLVVSGPVPQSPWLLHER